MCNFTSICVNLTSLDQTQWFLTFSSIRQQVLLYFYLMTRSCSSPPSFCIVSHVGKLIEIADCFSIIIALAFLCFLSLALRYLSVCFFSALFLDAVIWIGLYMQQQ